MDVEQNLKNYHLSIASDLPLGGISQLQWSVRGFVGTLLYYDIVCILYKYGIVGLD